MRYLLVVGFACDVYRQKPRARLFFNEQLIDEFLIPHHKNTLLSTVLKDFYQNKHILQPFLSDDVTNIKIKNFPPLRFYEIDIGTTLDKTKLCIEIKNSDSNYTNGFVTNSTLIKLQVCYFFPLHKKLLSRFKEIRNKNRQTQNYAWYRMDKNCIFDLIMNGLSWQGKNGQIVDSNRYNFKEYNLGGDGIITVELVKKYQVLIKKAEKFNRYIFNNTLVDYFVNKYEQHENQRNTD